ncbi:MAG: metallophosphoesterase [Flavipsychrobacter sp.]
MTKVIIHISDLHVSTKVKNDGRVNDSINSYLTTDANTESAFNFIDEFLDSIKKEFKDATYFLLVTGDIADTGSVTEYESASTFLKRIISGLGIKISECLILPGDHDVHRLSLLKELDERPNNSSHLLNEIKFKNFSTFYTDVTNEEYQFNNIIIKHIAVDPLLVLIGLNSNYKIDAAGGEGYVPVETFKAEIEALKEKYDCKRVQFVLAWHHNFTAGFEDTNRGQWERENRQHFLDELQRQNIKVILTGNEHTSNSRKVESIETSDCGSLTSIPHDAAFKVYPVNVTEEQISLGNVIFGLQKTQDNSSPFFWQRRDNGPAKQPQEFVLFVKNKQEIEAAIELPHSENAELSSNEKLGGSIQSKSIYRNEGISDYLYSIVKDKKLFHSGHFHWSETSRAHNWIDITKLLEDNSDLYFSQTAIMDIIDKLNLAEDCQLIIGLGYEGNILSSKASIKYNIPYTSLPYSYRYDDHHDYEKKLNFENTTGEFKTIIIVTDVVNDGRTIRKLIEREKGFFDNVKRVIVLSLFYTGTQELNSDILNYKNLPAEHDFESDYEVDNIEFYTVTSLRVERCPYGANYKTECFIYRDDLSCVHLFYNES